MAVWPEGQTLLVHLARRWRWLGYPHCLRSPKPPTKLAYASLNRRLALSRPIF